MREFYSDYLTETFDDEGRLVSCTYHYPDNFNYGYDILDPIAAAYPDRIAAAEAAVDKPIQLDRAAEGILSIFGVSSQSYPASENFLSPEFAIKPRYMMEGHVLYREDEDE